MIKNFKLSASILWLGLSLICATLSVYKTFYVAPEAGIIFALGVFLLTFPTGYLSLKFYHLLNSMDIVAGNLGVLGTSLQFAVFIIVGYIQWFVIVPCLYKKIKRKFL